MYTIDEFVSQCLLCGYASKKTAREYAKRKKELTDNDFVEVFRINERKNDLKHKGTLVKCNMNGDDLLNDLGKNSTPWNKDIDLNRGIRHMRERRNVL